jgi:DNA-binding transcriptional regulator YdaS (Cro superfamily)
MTTSETEQLLQAFRAWVDHAPWGAQRKVAEALGVSRSVVSNWYTGCRHPSLERGLKLQKFLNAQKTESDERNRCV